MARLKAETAEQHRVLEDTVDVLASLSSLASYDRMLVRTAGFVIPLEAAIGRHDWRSLGFRGEERFRSGAILKDLKVRNLPVPVEMELWPELQGTAFAVGAFYVLEGSTLGGMIIARQLKDRLDIDGTSGGGFFGGRGKATAAMWREFGNFVNGLDPHTANPDEIVAGANLTFERITSWFQS